MQQTRWILPSLGFPCALCDRRPAATADSPSATRHSYMLVTMQQCSNVRQNWRQAGSGGALTQQSAAHAMPGCCCAVKLLHRRNLAIRASCRSRFSRRLRSASAAGQAGCRRVHGTLLLGGMACRWQPTREEKQERPHDFPGTAMTGGCPVHATDAQASTQRAGPKAAI